MLFVPLILVVSCLCAGCYAGIAGFLSNRFGANMVIVTLMQNYVAQLFCSYLVNNVFVDDQASPGPPPCRSRPVLASSWKGIISPLPF